LYTAKSPQDGGIDIGLGLRALPAGGPPWILFDPRQGQLLTLDPGPAPGGARLAAREVKDAAGKRRFVLDAVPWRTGDLLLATDAGLAIYNVASGRLDAAPLAAPPRLVARLFVDRRDRLWLGGQSGGLWMIEGRRGPPRSFDAIPTIAGSTVEVIAADSDPDTVVVSLGERGILRLRLAR
jgi:ligand-binding sensor domain-containing protein